jgi:hypothetical protein
MRPASANGNGTLLLILQSIVQLLHHQTETLGRIDAKTDMLTKEERKESKLLSMAISILGHWGTISAMAVAAYRWGLPHIRMLLGL